MDTELMLEDIEEEDDTEEAREARMIAVSSRNPYTLGAAIHQASGLRRWRLTFWG